MTLCQSFLDKRTLQTWKSLISQHLGLRNGTKIQNLMLDIVAVDAGIKPCYLYDVGFSEPASLMTFIQSLAEENLISNGLSLLVIGLDCLIVNVEEVFGLSSREECSICLINVSSSLKDGPVFHDSVSDAKSILDVVQVVRDNLCVDVIKKFEIPQDEVYNITSLFGFLLDYPLIYWFEVGTGNGENCLSMEKLIVVQVFVGYKYTTKEKDLNSTNVQEREHCLFSFSYPCCLKDVAAEKMTDWFKDVKKRVNKSKFFCNARIHCEEKILEAVSL